MTITPPPELFTQWLQEALQQHGAKSGAVAAMVANRAAQWGADQELEACCKWLQCEAGDSATEFVAGDLRAARRPRPLSLKEQALEALDHILNNSSTELGASTIRRALEALPDDRT
jgi:hypothetical protein